MLARPTSKPAPTRARWGPSSAARVSKPPPLAIKGVDCLPPYCNLARALARRPHGLHPAPPQPPPLPAHSWRRGGRWRTGRRRRLRQDEGEESTRRRPSAGRRHPVCARPERGREQDLKKRRARSSCERACARGQTMSQRRPPSARGRRGQGQLRMHTGKPGRAPGCGETSHQMPTCGRGGMIGGVCRRGPRPGWVGQGDHGIVCAFGVEDRVLVGGDVVRYGTVHASVEPDVRTRRVVSEYRCAVKGGW